SHIGMCQAPAPAVSPRADRMRAKEDRTPMSSSEAWPALPYEAWAETRQTLHRWSQIVGKTRLALEPMLNHWWQVALYVSAGGLPPSAMPCSGGRLLEVELDFLDHQLVLRTSDGGRREVALAPRSVADFFAAYRNALAALDVELRIWPVPV